MELRIVTQLSEIGRDEWNALPGTHNPFLRHEFLAGLETFNCLAPYGWTPQHLIATENGRLVGAVPMYIKTNTYGEFVFDFSWAQAYENAGLAYFPKLVVAVPYSPVNGKRLLCSDPHVAHALMLGAREHAKRLNVSSLHWLFPSEQDTQQLEQHGYLRRTGCQFHWTNAGYRDFTDFLSTFSAQKRKSVKRERRRVLEAGVEIEILNGHQATDEHWQTFHRFYSSTFARLGGWATMSEAFFRNLGQTLPEQTLLVLCKHNNRYVAGAFCMRSDDTLYGRHWGCDTEFNSLHFEACYYQGIEYCIQHGLRYFEPGAQGEHKVGRGFAPTHTWSAHWLAEPGFHRAVADFVKREHLAMGEYMKELDEHLPFKQTLALGESPC